MESYSMDPVSKNNHSSPNSIDPNDGNSKSKPKEAKQIVYRFFHYTTINGLQRLASARTIPGRLFWIAVVLGAMAMFSKDIYDLVQQYYDRPVNVVSKVEYFRAMRFPAITFCNVNAIRKSVSRTISSNFSAKIEERENNACFLEAERGKNSECEEDKDDIGEFKNDIDHILSTVDENVLIRSGHQRKDFIISCRFNGIRCRNKKYWTQFWDPQYGNCFVFNSRLTGHNANASLFRTNKPGSAYGLKLSFNIELGEYIPQLTTDAGIKVIITEPNEMPFPIYNSLSLAPGFNNEIEMKRIQIKRVDRFENGSCRVDRRLDSKNPYRVRYGADYSNQACFQYCYALSQIDKCGCAEYSYYSATPKKKVCDESKPEVEKCIDSWIETEGLCEKTCRDQCSETIYESSLTFTQWPHAQSVESILRSFGFNYSDYGNNIDIVRSNFLSANIFFQRFRETKIEESLSYETANLLADIGGQVGLWAGLSVISMCELIELFALLLRSFLQRQRAQVP